MDAFPFVNLWNNGRKERVSESSEFSSMASLQGGLARTSSWEEEEAAVGGGDMPRDMWIKDKESPMCYTCEANFTVLNRR